MKKTKKSPSKEKKMTAREKMLYRAYDPYRQLMKIEIIPHLLFRSFLIVFLVLCITQNRFSIYVVVLFIAVLIVSYIGSKQNFYPGVFSYFEDKYELTQTQELTITKIERADMYHPLDVLRSLYDKRLQVAKYKLICRDSNGKKVVLRSIMSIKRYRLLVFGLSIFEKNDLTRQLPLTCSVTYGKYTHIIWWFNTREEWADKFNHSF